MQDGDTLRMGRRSFAAADGSMIKKIASIPVANGAGLSPDGKTVNVSDTIVGRLRAMMMTGPGTVSPGPLLSMPGTVMQMLLGYQWADSLKVAHGGNICVGTIYTGAITVFSPEGDIEQLHVPDMFPTNLCFGGADMRGLWITASSTGKI